VIRAYIKSKEMAEEEMTEADSLAPTGDADKDARARKRYTARFYRLLWTG
jgi:transcription initiation factor TFIID subunit 1, fungi type